MNSCKDNKLFVEEELLTPSIFYYFMADKYLIWAGSEGSRDGDCLGQSHDPNEK